MFFALDRSLTSDFPDVPADSPYYPYVASAQHDNIVNGYSDGTFSGEDPITREQAAVILYRLFLLLYEVRPVALELPQTAPVENGAASSGVSPAVIAVSVAAVAAAGGGAGVVLLRKKKIPAGKKDPSLSGKKD